MHAPAELCGAAVKSIFLSYRRTNGGPAVRPGFPINHLNAVVGLMRSWTEEDSAHIDETVRNIYRMMAASMNAFAPGGATRLPEKLKD